MKSIPKHDGQIFDDTPGPWWAPRLDAGDPAVWSAYVKCPNGHIAGIGTHEIADDGTVTPSVVCSGESHCKTDGTDSDGCDWQEYIKLEGWVTDDE